MAQEASLPSPLYNRGRCFARPTGACLATHVRDLRWWPANDVIGICWSAGSHHCWKITGLWPELNDWYTTSSYILLAKPHFGTHMLSVYIHSYLLTDPKTRGCGEAQSDTRHHQTQQSHQDASLDWHAITSKALFGTFIC